MTIEAKLTITDGNRNLSVSLSTHELATLTSILPDRDGLTDIFDVLSRHTDSAVREAVAGKKFLSESAVKRLATDPAIAVLDQLLNSGEPCGYLSGAELLSICQRDPSLAELVAGCVGASLQNDEFILAYLETHSDTSVRARLAENAWIPQSVLQRLAEHDVNEQVRDLARESRESDWGE